MSRLVAESASKRLESHSNDRCKLVAERERSCSLPFTAQRSPTQEPGLGEEMQTPTPAMSRNRNQDLDPLRLRLVQLIDAVSHLQSQLAAYQHHPSPTHALPPFLELVNRYNLLLTNLAAIHRLVSSEQDQQDQLQPPPRRAGESADPKRDKWDSLAVVPAHRVDESKDWIVGTLLRTKQVRLLFTHTERLLQTAIPVLTYWNRL